MVLAADSQADKVADVLRASIREVGSPLVLDDGAFGDLSDLYDDEIVAKASHFPVQRLLIVRSVEAGKPDEAADGGGSRSNRTGIWGWLRAPVRSRLGCRRMAPALVSAC